MTLTQLRIIKQACLYAMTNADSLTDSFTLKECCDELDWIIEQMQKKKHLAKS